MKALITRQDYEANQAATEARFATAVAVGTKGNPLERGIEMAVKGLAGECSTGNQPWLRSEATPAVLIVSDEENCGSAVNEGCNTTTGYTHYGPQEFLNAAPVGTKVYGIFYDRAVCEDDGYEKDPTDYYNLVTATNGLWDEICQDDYAATLQAISKDVSQVVVHKFSLAETPDAGSLVIKIDDVATADYALSGKTVQLTGTVPDNSKLVTIDYLYGSTPRIKKYQLSSTPDASTLLIKVDGVIAGPADYAFDAAGKTIEFANMPPDDSSITAAYRTSEELKKKFKVAKDILEKSVVVAVSGQTTADFEIDKPNKEIKFKKAPQDGAQIKITYNKPGDLVTQYSVDAIDETKLKEMKVVDTMTNHTISAQLSDGHLVIDEDEVFQGRSVKAQFKMDEVMPEQATLMFEPMQNSLQFKVADGLEDCVSKFAVIGRDIALTCPGLKMEWVEISYNHLSEYRTEFTVSGKITDESTWHVWVDGVEITDYTIDGRTVKIPDNLLTYTSIVKIVVN